MAIRTIVGTQENRTTSPIDMGNQKITTLATPTVSTDASTKGYVDTTSILVANYVVRETPSGAVDGVNVTFTLAFTPVTGTEMNFLNGILQDEGVTNDYTIAGAVITYGVAPLTGDKIRVTYLK